MALIVEITVLMVLAVDIVLETILQIVVGFKII
jgi:hypothetical protein